MRYIKANDEAFRNQFCISSLWPDAILDIADDVSLEPFTTILCHKKIVIEEGCQIASGVKIVDHNHYIPKTREEMPLIKKAEKAKAIHIGKYCWIGSNACILKGVTLGDGCIVGAGAIVTKSFPSGSIIVGVPAKVVKQRWT